MKPPLDPAAPPGEPTASAYFECPLQGASFCLRLGLDVAGRLHRDALGGYAAVPRRGLEIGGLLLGRVEKDCVAVENCEPFACEHERGPSYVLSARDRARLAEQVRRIREDGARVVGLYRSFTRAAASPNEQDIALMAEHCPGAECVLLLVKAEVGRPARAFAYAGGEGLRQAPAEFPLDRVRLGEAANSSLPYGAVADDLSWHLERSRRRAPVLEIRPPGLSRWAIAAVLLVATAAGYGFARWRTTPPASAAPPVRLRSMALNVTWNAGSLHLSWDRDAPVIRNASRGVVWIGDGGEQRRLELDPRELAEGSLQYWPSSSNVDFKLEVFSASDSARESVRAIRIPVPPADAQGTKSQSRGPADWTPGAPRPIPARFVIPETDHFTRVEIEIPKDSGLHKLAGKSRPTVAPTPLYRVIPDGPPELRARWRSEVAVDVKLDVDATGKVKRATLAARHTDAARELDELALASARRWTFTPAHYGQRHVASKVVLHYHFGHSMLADARLP